jgi:ADP-ribose pyrophosphatase YjhB (NUDIX family)
MSTHRRPEIQLIVNLALVDPDRRVLLVGGRDEAERWSLPGWELEPYEHPDDGARQLLVDFLGLPEARATLVYVDSFRGRRGWHVTFNYRTEVTAEPHCERPIGWFALEAFPRTVHGRWERDVAARLLDA